MSLFNQRLSRVKCSQCRILIPLKQWKEHLLQHAALRVLKLSQYPKTFLSLTQHFINELSLIECYHDKEIARNHLVSAYDTLKMLYFKNFSPRPATAPPSLPAFDNMEDSMPAKDYNYSTSLDPDSTNSPWPYSYSVFIEQFSAGLYHCELELKETEQAFFTDYGNTPVPGDNLVKGSLWGSALFEGLSGSFAARAASEECLEHVKTLLVRNMDPSHQDIRKALQHALHNVDVSLKQGHNELGQSRWSGVTGCVTVLQSAPERGQYLDTDLVKSEPDLGTLHIANIGNITAVLSRAGEAKRVSYLHLASDKVERSRVLNNGGCVSSNGQINAVTSVTRALGFHGDSKLRKCLSRKAFTSSIDLTHDDEFLIIGNWRLWKYLGEDEAVSLCKTVLTPSTKKLVQIFSQLPDTVQEEILSSKSTMDYDALVSEMGDYSVDSSMVADNESEIDIAGVDVMDWKAIFNDPLANLSERSISQLLSETMSASLVGAARDAGAVGPLGCSIVLLPGALPAARKRLLFEQVVYELMKRYENRYNISEVSLLSFTEGLTTIKPCDVQIDSMSSDFDLGDGDSDLMEFREQRSPTPVLEPSEPVVADQLQLDDGELVFKDCGVLLLKPGIDTALEVELRPDIKLDTAMTQSSIQEQRDLIRDMVSIALQKTEEERQDQDEEPVEKPLPTRSKMFDLLNSLGTVKAV